MTSWGPKLREASVLLITRYVYNCNLKAPFANPIGGIILMSSTVHRDMYLALL